MTTRTSATLRSNANPYPVLVSSPAVGRMIQAMITPVTATTPTATRAESLKRRTIVASLPVSSDVRKATRRATIPPSHTAPAREMDDVGGDHRPSPLGRPGVPLEGESGQGNEGEHERDPSRGASIDEHGDDEQGVGRDRGGDPDRTAQRRHQHVVVAQGVETTSEASDAERHSGDQCDGSEDGSPAGDRPQLDPPIGVHREEQRSGGDEGAGVSDRRQGGGAGTNSPARRVASRGRGRRR